MMDDLSQAHLDHLDAEREPPNTIASRRRVLTSLGNAGTASREEVEAWWATRRDKAPGDPLERPRQPPRLLQVVRAVGAPRGRPDATD
jgi:hypothetical protein